MNNNTLTYVAIFVILGCVTLFAYKRTTKVLREARAKEALRQQALLSEVMTLGVAGPQGAVTAESAVSASAAKSPEVENQNSRSTGVQGDGEVRSETRHEELPGTPSVQRDISAFFGGETALGTRQSSVPESTNAEPSTPDLVAGPTAPGPQSPGNDTHLGRDARFDAAVAHLSLALRKAADEVEALALSEGSVAERSVQVLSAVTASVQALPLGGLMTLPVDGDTAPRP